MSSSPSSTSWSLIRDAARGHGPARSVFAKTYLPLVRAFFAARWRGNPLTDDVEDGIQETFVECFREDGPLAKAEANVRDFRAYLFGIVRHVAQRFEERRGRLPDAASVDVQAIQARDDRLSQVFDRGWAHTMMRLTGELMQARSEAGGAAARLRIELLRLRFQKGLPIREIAAQWEMDPDAVHRAYARARDEFHTCLRLIVREHAVRTEEDLDAECRRLLAMLG